MLLESTCRRSLHRKPGRRRATARGACWPLHGGANTCLLLGALLLSTECGGKSADTTDDAAASTGGTPSLPSGGTGLQTGGQLQTGGSGGHHDSPTTGGRSNPGGAAGAAGSPGQEDDGGWIDADELTEVSEVSGKYHLVSQRGSYLLIDGDIDIRFGGTPERFSWRILGCNQHDSDYEIVDGTLETGPFESTQSNCGQITHAWENWLEPFWREGPSIWTYGENLVLATDDAQLVFAPGEGPRAQLLPTAPLQGTTWTVTDLSASAGTWGYFVPDPDVLGTLLFDETGALTITGPCNVGSGQYEIIAPNETLRVGALGWTKKACTDPDATLREQILRDTLDDASLRFSIYDQTLNLVREPRQGEVGQYTIRARADLE